MHYNFDEILDRRGTLSTKWHVPPDVIPLPVADMDFRTAKPIIREMVQIAQFGVCGYSYYPDCYGQAVCGWMQRRHAWHVDPEWITLGTTVVAGLNISLQALTDPGDGVIIQQPVYHPFFDMIALNHRTPRINPLILENDRYRMDIPHLRLLAQEASTKAMILCSPHNPSGRIWSREELRQVLEICCENDLFLLADEIHADIVLPGHTFVALGDVAAEMGDEALRRVIICTSAGKSFNIAGLHTSSIIIPGPPLRERYREEARKNSATSINAFGVMATTAAYNECEDWLEQVISYISGNFDYFKSFLRQFMPELIVYPSEATYLAWVDCRAWGLSSEALTRFFEAEARVIVHNGTMFGQGGEGFVRLNLACRRELLRQALNRILDARNRVSGRRTI